MPEMYGTRRVDGLVGINGVNVWGDIKEYVTDIEYIDVASGENDSFDITLIDSDNHFINDWLIDKGTEINAKFKLQNWGAPGVEKWVDCGTFLCDALKVRGFPCEVTIQSLALPKSGTKNTQKWEKTAISAIANEIAYRCGCELKYYADDIVVKSAQQSRQTDIEFLFKLCTEYGFGMKVYRDSIVIFSREQQDAAEAVGDPFDITEAEEFTLTDNEEGTYTGVECKYKPEGQDNELKYTYGTSERLLVMEGNASSAKEAELKGKAALYNANIQRVKLKLKVLAGEPFYAGTNRIFNSLGAYSGKYAIDKVTHNLSGEAAYRLTIEAHAVDIEKDAAPVAVENATASGSEEIAAGKAITLDNAPLYISSDATNPARRMSGTYYLYDGVDFNGRYRICHDYEVGQTPVGQFVMGYIDAEYVK